MFSRSAGLAASASSREAQPGIGEIESRVVLDSPDGSLDRVVADMFDVTAPSAHDVVMVMVANFVLIPV
jgi:hypothetical protein